MDDVTHSGASAPRPPMTILQVVPELETGGAERTTIDIARALSAEGHRALVASQGGRLERALEDAGGTLLRIPAATKNPQRMFANIQRLMTLCKLFKVDLIHARSRAPAWSAYIAASISKRPFLTTYHGTYNARTSIKRFYNSVMVRGRYVIANSAFIAEHIRSTYDLPAERIVTIPRGVDLTTFDPEKIDPSRVEALRQHWQTDGHNGKTTFLLPGRLTRWKGQHVFVEALAKLTSRSSPGADWQAVMIGDAQGRDQYEQDLLDGIDKAGLRDHIKLAGHCTDMPAAYRAADVIVTPSLEPEAFGRVAAEAQAMGRPIVAADHGGARETVIDMKSDPARGTGWRVMPGDAGSLAEALAASMSMPPEDREAMAMRGQSLVREKFSLEMMARDTLSLYKRMIAESSGNGRD